MRFGKTGREGKTAVLEIPADKQPIRYNTKTINRYDNNNNNNNNVIITKSQTKIAIILLLNFNKGHSV